MIKDNVRDYTVDAFSFYCKMGQPDTETFKQKVYSYAMQKFDENDFLTEEQKIINAQNLYNDMKPMIHDVEAVNKTIKKATHHKNGAYILKALKTVYFHNTEKNFDSGDYSRLVHKAEIEIPASEATVYRYLKAARAMFAAERGLRTSQTMPPDFRAY